MIQRIQSLFLLCTAIVTGLLFFMPVASIVVPNNFTYAFYTTKVVQAGSPCVFITWNWMSLILNALITTLAVVTIFIHHKKSKTVKPTLFCNCVFVLSILCFNWG